MRREATNNPSPPPFTPLNVVIEITPGGVPERPKGADCKSAVIDFEGSNPSPPPSSSPNFLAKLIAFALCSAHAGKDEKLRSRFDSSDSEKALPQATTRRAKRNALSHPSPPPSSSRNFSAKFIAFVLCSAHAGKDEKLRSRFDSSDSEKALPQATTRRAKRNALSHPSPPPSSSRNFLAKLIAFARYSAHAGRMRNFDQGSIRAIARKRCRRQRPEGRSATR